MSQTALRRPTTLKSPAEVEEGNETEAVTDGNDYIFGEIGWDVQAVNVIQDIQDTKDDEINVIISSGGGSAFEGLMIYDALKIV